MQSDSPRNRFVDLLKKAGLDGFFLGLILAVALAYLNPAIGRKEGPLPLGTVISVGVAFIFFFYGLRLSAEKLRAGLSNWRLHLVVQLTTFLLFPLVVLGIRPFFQGAANESFWPGIFYLAALPSTVSSSVVMVSIAGGNMAAAIFNASISGLIGILVTPLWVSAVLPTAQGGVSLWSTVGDLAVQVLLPVVVGIFLNPRLGAWAERHRGRLRLFDQSIILLMVYTSFCDSFARGIFSAYGAVDILLLAVGMAALFFLVYGWVNGLSRLFGFKADDRIVALFCGSKKSLVHGTVMANVLFSNSTMAGILLLPLMVYHALQILIASIIAQAMSRRTNRAAGASG